MSSTIGPGQHTTASPSEMSVFMEENTMMRACSWGGHERSEQVMDRNAWLGHTLLGPGEGLQWLLRSLSSMAPASVMLRYRNAGESAVGAIPEVCTTVPRRCSTCETSKDYQVFKSLTSQTPTHIRVMIFLKSDHRSTNQKEAEERGERNAVAKRFFRKQQDLKRFV